MGSIGRAAARGCSAGKVESPVAESVATGQQSTIEISTVTDEAELQNQVTELQKKVLELQEQVKSLETKLSYSRKQKKELEHELAEVERFNRELQNGEAMKRVTDKLQQAEDKLQTVSRERFELQNQLQTSQLGNSVQPDYNQIRDRTLNKLKLGRQSAGGKAIDAFIKELQR